MASPASSNPIGDWLATLDADELTDLLTEAMTVLPGFTDWLDTRRIADGGASPDDLLALVNRNLNPTKRFYDYRQANEYAYDAHDTVQLIAQLADEASPDLLPVIERAITLTTRAILKSDDSSGLQGDLVRTLLRAHGAAARSAEPALTQAQQTKLVDWIVKYRYGGTQDFFDPDIVAYAPALSPKSIARYRDAIARTDLGDYGSYPLTRLAVLDADRDAIIAAHGGDLTNSHIVKAIVFDLEEAGLHDDAVAYARIGITLDGRGWDSKLIDFLVDDALTRGEDAEALSLRRDWYAKHPSSTSFSALRKTAEQVGRWETERDAAEERLAARDAASFVAYLIEEGRGDAAWQFAQENRDRLTSAATWLNLCTDRAKTHPADTLPIYRAVISDTLVVTDVRNYKAAAKILKTMRDVADSAGPAYVAEFDQFLAETVDENRRRPRCIQEFAKAKLIAGR